jgi:hypothetical protein
MPHGSAFSQQDLHSLSNWEAALVNAMEGVLTYINCMAVNDILLIYTNSIQTGSRTSRKASIA